MKELFIYSDGGSFNNGFKDPNKPMYGSYGSIIVKDNNIIREYSDWYENCTNNQGELYGFIRAYLQFLKKYKSKEPYKITVISDSQYLIDGVNKYLENWKKKNWHTASGGEVKNVNMWKIIDFLINSEENITLEFKWQKGHKGKAVSKEENPYIFFNEYCDSLATNKISEALEKGKNYLPPDAFENQINTLIKKFNLN